MTPLDVYGIGNALLDIEREVSDAVLVELGLQKGSMTLVDVERQQAILAKIGGAGGKRTCGGSAANTIIGVAMFGGRSFHSCKVANDPMGDLFVQALRDCDVATNVDEAREAGVTGSCVVLITPDGERTMCTHLGISALISPQEVREEALRAARYLYVEGYLVSSPTGLQAALAGLRLARAHGVKTAFTLSDVSMIRFCRAGVDAILAEPLDLLFCNEAEALALAGSDDLGQAKALLRQHAATVCITLGPKGAVVLQGNGEIDIPSTPVQAKDSNGAGDLFAGAFLYGITHGLDVAQAGRLACAASAVLVTQFGARLKAGQAEEIKQSVGVA